MAHSIPGSSIETYQGDISACLRTGLGSSTFILHRSKHTAPNQYYPWSVIKTLQPPPQPPQVIQHPPQTTALRQPHMHGLTVHLHWLLNDKALGMYFLQTTGPTRPLPGPQVGASSYQDSELYAKPRRFMERQRDRRIEKRGTPRKLSFGDESRWYGLDYNAIY